MIRRMVVLKVRGHVQTVDCPLARRHSGMNVLIVYGLRRVITSP